MEDDRREDSVLWTVDPLVVTQAVVAICWRRLRVRVHSEVALVTNGARGSALVAAEPGKAIVALDRAADAGVLAALTSFAAHTARNIL